MHISGQLTDEQKNAIRQQAGQLVSTTVADASASEIYAAASVVGAWDGLPTPANTEDSYVMMLAACELGYDCTWSNPDLSLPAQCSAAGSCPGINTLQDWIQQQLAYSGDAAYADAFSRAAQFAGYVRSGSADLALGLLRFQVPQSGPDTARPAAPSAARR